MSAKIFLDSQEIKYKRLIFSGGEVQVKLETPILTNDRLIDATIHTKLKNSDDIMELLMLTDALRREYGSHVEITLYMPYIPYARQDRVCARGEALAIKVFADLLNQQNYKRVVVSDAHSDVAPALINRCTNIHQSALLTSVPKVAEILVSPDAGANKKVYEIAKQFPMAFKQVIRADKIRDVSNGKITGTEVYCGDLGGQNVLIVDDICDGGATFIGLAKALKEKNVGKIYLYVTHGIFSKGLEPFKGLIDEIFTSNSFIETDDPILTII